MSNRILTSVPPDNEIVQLQQEADDLAHIVHVREQKHKCETLYAEGRIVDAAASLLEIKNTTSAAVRGDALITDWIAGEFWHCEPREVIVRFHEPMRIDAGSKWRQGVKSREL